MAAKKASTHVFIAVGKETVAGSTTYVVGSGDTKEGAIAALQDNYGVAAALVVVVPKSSVDEHDVPEFYV